MALEMRDARESVYRLLRLTMIAKDAKFVINNNNFNSSLKIALDKLEGL